ncbi:MAG: hypothetical protein KIT84_02915 [Labilithrix sp.]|nr:hypothetical protein [Labilithrix sp.]MCW5809933.1 hypothetical protein [Labilithrix sp.]
MKVIFLDIDGVLNSQAWLDRARGGAAAALLDPSLEASWLDMLDPECVARLDRLAARHDAKVVISSSWRLMLAPETIARMLREKGFNGEVIGATTRLEGLVRGNVTERGHQIAHWLAASASVESFVILDDATDMAHLGARHVHTSFAVGLTDADVERASELLARGSDSSAGSGSDSGSGSGSGSDSGSGSERA